MDLLQEIKGLEPRMLEWFRHLHRNPEIEMELPKTVAFVCERLKEMGIEPTVLPEASSVVAVIGSGDGPVVALRADMDALRVQEETGLPYASEVPGMMHACGHDGHTAMLLAAARYLKAHEAELPGRVKLLFQAAEENLRGAKAMIAAGALENPHVDRVLALHAGSFCGDYPDGDFILSEGVTFFSSDNIRITVAGRGGHAAAPHLAVDPIITAARIIEGLQQLVAREVSPNVPAVLSITHIHAGDETFNVIPDGAVLMGGIRTVNPERREYLIRRAEEIAVGIGTAMGASVTFERVDGCPATINDKDVALEVQQSAEKIFPGQLHWMKEANTCSEDASYFLEARPGCYLFLASKGLADDGVHHSHHNAKFCLNETVLWKGAAVLVQAALDQMAR